MKEYTKKMLETIENTIDRGEDVLVAIVADRQVVSEWLEEYESPPAREPVPMESIKGVLLIERDLKLNRGDELKPYALPVFSEERLEFYEREDQFYRVYLDTPEGDLVLAMEKPRPAMSFLGTAPQA